MDHCVTTVKDTHLHTVVINKCTSTLSLPFSTKFAVKDICKQKPTTTSHTTDSRANLCASQEIFQALEKRDEV